MNSQCSQIANNRLISVGKTGMLVKNSNSHPTPVGSAISVDTVIGNFQSGREIGENNSLKSELFPIWAQTYTLKGDKRITVIKDYLDN